MLLYDTKAKALFCKCLLHFDSFLTVEYLGKSQNP